MNRYELDTWNCELVEDAKGEYCKWKDISPFIRALEKFSLLECAAWNGATTESPYENYCSNTCPSCIARYIIRNDQESEEPKKYPGDRYDDHYYNGESTEE